MIGTQVSHYGLARKLGSGTYGEVFEGVHQHDAELKVAVKLVARALVDDARFVEALKKECRQLDRMDHANIVRFRELVVNEGGVAMVLELLEGQDLHERLAGGPLALETAVSVTEAILEGLAYAHARGVMHRDIKPSNVYWCDDGRIKLLDFGIARAADGTAATKTGHMVGTLDYMAPERFDDRGGSMASDVYAVGLIAWELLAGRAACPDGEFGRKLGWHLAQGVGDAAKIGASLQGCPAWFAEVIATLAARDPGERPVDGATALAMLREKRPADPGVPVQGAARRPPPSTVMGPAPVGSTPPVGASVPPRSVPPPSSGSAGATGRSAPPGTVVGPAPSGASESVPPPSSGSATGRSAPPGTVVVEAEQHHSPQQAFLGGTGGGAEHASPSSLPSAEGGREVGEALAWVMAFTPLLFAFVFVLSAVVMEEFMGLSSEDVGVVLDLVFGLAAASAASMMLAASDVRLIRRLVGATTLDPMMGMVPLWYLYRRRAELREGMAPLAVHALVSIVVGGFLFAVLADM